ncbi:MAG: serine/threonine-protein phosphatase [Ruminococcus sp.]|nr:serine/threonine-protein phosphatase [Ruminococcus sp.]
MSQINRTLEIPSASPSKPKRHISYRVANLQGIGARQRQEDAFAFANVLDVVEIRNRGMLAIVCDGMGGMKDGRLASDNSIEVIRAAYNDFDYDQDIFSQLKAALLSANERVYSLLEGEGGSTAIICLFYNSSLYFASVGDSYLIIKRGHHLYHLNKKHNVLHEVYAETIRSGGFDPAIARADAEKDAVTQYLGIDELTDIDGFVRPLPLQDGDVVMLCSDGVAGVLPDHVMLQCLENEAPEQMTAELEQNIIAASLPYQDNYTALIIKCEY